MKKTFILLFAIGTITTAFAQGDYSNRAASRDVILGNDRSTVYNENRGWSDKDNTKNDMYNRRKDEEIRKLNNDYDSQISIVSRNRSISSKEKSRQVERLKIKRTQKTKDIYRRYASNKSYNDRNNKRF